MVGHRSGALGSATLILFAILALAVGVSLIGTLDGAVQAIQQVLDYQPPTQLVQPDVCIPEGLPIAVHAEKHQGEKLDAWIIYEMWMAGECVVEEMWCSAGEGDAKLFLCKPAMSDLWGGLVVLGGELIYTGFGAREAYWRGRINAQWEVCSD